MSEDTVMELVQAMKKAAPKEISQQAISITVAAALSVLLFVVSSTWYVAGKLGDFTRKQDAMTDQLYALTHNKHTWSVGHEAETWIDFQRKNDSLKLSVPDPYSIRAKIGER